MRYEIIGTGSKGNALLLDGWMLVDCGLPYKAIKEYAAGIKLVLLTHSHADHFNITAIRRLAAVHPKVRFCAPVQLVPKLQECGIGAHRIDISKHGKRLSYGSAGAEVYAFQLVHDVPNVGYRIALRCDDGRTETALYITDTGSVEQIPKEISKGCDYYFIEANYKEAEIQEKIREKQALGEFVYETRVVQTHLSYEQAVAFLADNARSDSKVLFIHGHQEKEGEDNGQEIPAGD